jgi:hypothetical protein
VKITAIGGVLAGGGVNEWNFVGTMKRRRKISREVEILYGGGKSVLDLNRGEGFRTLVRGDLVSITSSALHRKEGELQRIKKVPETPSSASSSLRPLCM